MLKKFLAVQLMLLSAYASATVVTFDDQGYFGPSVFNFNAGPQQISLSVDGRVITFNGGVVITAATNLPANRTSIYGTASFVNGLNNLIQINLDKPVDYVSLDVLNGNIEPIRYFISDDKGNASSVVLQPNLNGGKSRVEFSSGGKQINITSSIGSRVAYDFFIDNVNLESYRDSHDLNFTISYNSVEAVVFSKQLTFSSSVSAEEKALENVKLGFGQDSERAGTAAKVIKQIPSSVTDGAKSAVQGYVIDRAVDQIDSKNTKETVEIFNTITDASQNPDTGFVEYYKTSSAGVLSGFSKIFNKLSNDPPDPNYLEVASKSNIGYDLGFEKRYGGEFSLFDEAFKKLFYGLEDYELFLTSLERMQGALLDGDISAFSRQRKFAEELLHDANKNLIDASEGFKYIESNFFGLGLADYAVDLSVIYELRNFININGKFPDDIISDFVSRGFDQSFIDSIAYDILNDLISIPDEYIDFSIFKLTGFLSDFAHKASFSSLLGNDVNIKEPPVLIMMAIGFLLILYRYCCSRVASVGPMPLS